MIYRKPCWVDKLYQQHREAPHCQEDKEKEVVVSRKLTDNKKYCDNNLCSASYRRFVISAILLRKLQTPLMYSVSGIAWGQCFHVTSQELLLPLRLNRLSESHAYKPFCCFRACAYSPGWGYIHQQGSPELGEVLNQAAPVWTLHSHAAIICITFI